MRYLEKGDPEYVNNDAMYLLRIDKDEKSHYIYIKHLQRFFNLNRIVSNKDKSYCPYCEKQCEENMSDHIKQCYKLQFNDGSLLKLPDANSYMKFENHKNKLTRPFIVYADCESTLLPTTHKNKINKHKINSCCCYFVCTFDSTRNELFSFVGDNCLKEMTDKLFDIADNCIAEMKINNRMVMTSADEQQFENASCCLLCNEPFDDQDKALCKVRDHDHFTGKYRGAAHCKCNINFFSNRYLPIVFHNLRGYDSHLIIKEMYQLYPDKDLNIIPNSYEKLMSFKMGKLKFIDSIQFMNSSLEDLVENLYDYEQDDKYINFPSVKQYYKDYMHLACRKGLYPYERKDDDDNSKFNYQGLPPESIFIKIE